MQYVILWLVALSPALPVAALLLTYGRVIAEKINEVEQRLRLHAATTYAKAYGGTNVRQTLQEHFHWKTYVAPGGFLAIVIVVSTVVALIRSGVDLGLGESLTSLAEQTPVLTLVGLGGAYLWALGDLVRKHRSADLTPHVLNVAWMKMLVAAALGPLVGSAMQEPASYWAAFAIGAIPVATLWETIRNRSSLSVQAVPAEGATLHRLEGCTSNVIDRLAEEDITSVQHLAFANPVKLLFRTNLEWSVILDLVDQALLTNYVGEDIVKLRPIGVRGAIELAAIYDVLIPGQDVTDFECANAKRMLKQIGEVLGHGEAAAINIAGQVHADPVVKFVWDAYTGSDDEVGNAEEKHVSYDFE